MHTIARTLLIMAALAACSHPHRGASRAEWIAPPGPGKRPFSEVVRVGRMLYLSGQLGTDSTGHLVSGGIQAETRQALENIKHVLADNGSPWYFQGTADNAWPDTLIEQLKSIPASAFEAVDTSSLQVSAGSAAAR